ncbi:MAG: HGGxSTG domain-containing protein [Pyrinomonadaceae bacterium]
MQLWHSPRCGAKTRSGTPCRAPAVGGKRRCRMHGGTSTGPPKGSQNALKHGRYTVAAILERHKTRLILRELQQLIKLAHE